MVTVRPSLVSSTAGTPDSTCRGLSRQQERLRQDFRVDGIAADGGHTDEVADCGSGRPRVDQMMLLGTAALPAPPVDAGRRQASALEAEGEALVDRDGPRTLPAATRARRRRRRR